MERVKREVRCVKRGKKVENDEREISVERVKREAFCEKREKIVKSVK